MTTTEGVVVADFLWTLHSVRRSFVPLPLDRFRGSRSCLYPFSLHPHLSFLPFVSRPYLLPSSVLSCPASSILSSSLYRSHTPLSFFIVSLPLRLVCLISPSLLLAASASSPTGLARQPCSSEVLSVQARGCLEKCIFVKNRITRRGLLRGKKGKRAPRRYNGPCEPKPGPIGPKFCGLPPDGVCAPKKEKYQHIYNILF